mmetsp:Transcript_127061/g.329651  ORF Transcript_127061/g.329651 Transcript_127061/m.329651 type:complete len:214 (+) Transcript_127061:2081-2722(+)
MRSWHAVAFSLTAPGVASLEASGRGYHGRAAFSTRLAISLTDGTPVHISAPTWGPTTHGLSTGSFAPFADAHTVCMCRTKRRAHLVPLSLHPRSAGMLTRRCRPTSTKLPSGASSRANGLAFRRVAASSTRDRGSTANRTRAHIGTQSAPAMAIGEKTENSECCASHRGTGCRMRKQQCALMGLRSRTGNIVRRLTTLCRPYFRRGPPMLTRS